MNYLVKVTLTNKNTGKTFEFEQEVSAADGADACKEVIDSITGFLRDGVKAETRVIGTSAWDE